MSSEACSRFSQRRIRLQGKTGKILVIDDDPRSGLALEALLKTNGWQARHVPDGATAVMTLASWLPDVFVVDLSMPGHDGFAVAQVLRGLQPTMHAPIIAFTAFSEAEARAKGSFSSFDGYCQKGRSAESLLRLVGEFFDPPATTTNTTAAG